MDIQALQEKFKEAYGREPERVYFAPGRVNLIGEHIDYNGGRVFPCALSFGTYLAVAQTDAGRVRVKSENMPGGRLLSRESLKERSGDWTDYPFGVVWEFCERGILPWGYDILYWGDIPNRAGLSSSASLEMVTAVMLDDAAAAGLGRVELAKMCQHAENDFVGMNCGIMDQFAVAMGRRGYAIALDCATLAYELVPLDIAGYKLVITNSNKHHDLVTSEYNARRAQCERALEIVRRRYPVDALCALRPEQLEDVRDLFADETLYRRVRHAVTENARVGEAIAALRVGDLRCFGVLMNESHRSLKEDYEVTGVEMDTLAEEAQRLDGVLGSRITGGGFGGCTVSLVREDAVESFIEKLGATYMRKVGLRADFHIADVGDGAKRIY